MEVSMFEKVMTLMGDLQSAVYSLLVVSDAQLRAINVRQQALDACQRTMDAHHKSARK